MGDQVQMTCQMGLECMGKGKINVKFVQHCLVDELILL